MTQLNIKFLSTGEPTYWPADKNKSDILDFALMKGISGINTKIEGNLDLVSDHSAITVTLSTHAITKESIPKLCTCYALKAYVQVDVFYVGVFNF
jgi:hypothetical protein